MPVEFGLWRVDGAPVRIGTSRMPSEERLEELIETDPGILGSPLLLIGRQVPTDHGKFIDLLGMDAEGGLHVLELKRDRTPRDVVAQALDYGSWVQDLTNERIRAVYASYARQGGKPEELDEAFAQRFGYGPPETLNTSHTLTVVASEMDAATERIVTYLAGYRVPINVLFFRYFEDGGRSYLARTWLVEEPDLVAQGMGTATGEKREPWNGTDWFVSFGEEPGTRAWEDARRYGFVSAGGGEWFSRTLRSLPTGARIFTHIPKSGYVGIGTVTGEARPFEEATVTVDGEVKRLADLRLDAGYRHEGGETGAEDRREWVVPVTWERTVPRTAAVWRTGFFANQNSACKLRARFTIDEVSRAFGTG
ncbi:hypothetical protein GCM10027160_32230 [Streptomyces calidiresistens]|uniref:DUF91 domain-containing protein n=1 Tax=Streptomyces calidiresistens TaxID=1485586 RepID=A0A7W3XYL4_9ACTN|nr:endonuclease NucS domain-containing protein [Streptomyces calidiresistens]MBB0231951.1 DUF91 domain-containing protein [Streptomyces calidiresistens]